MKDDSIEINVRKLLSKNIKRYRLDLHMSQMDLSDNTGLAHNFINEIEQERKWPSSSSIEKLAKALKKEPYQLLVPETKWGMNGTDIFLEELSDSIATVVKEKCDRYIMESSGNESGNNELKKKQKKA